MRHDPAVDSGRSIPGKCLGHLAREPSLRRIFGDIKMDDCSSVVAENDQGVETPKRRGCNDEHVDRRNVGRSLCRKLTPPLGDQHFAFAAKLAAILFLGCRRFYHRAHPRIGKVVAGASPRVPDNDVMRWTRPSGADALPWSSGCLKTGPHYAPSQPPFKSAHGVFCYLFH